MHSQFRSYTLADEPNGFVLSDMEYSYNGFSSLKESKDHFRVNNKLFKDWIKGIISGKFYKMFDKCIGSKNWNGEYSYTMNEKIEKAFHETYKPKKTTKKNADKTNDVDVITNEWYRPMFISVDKNGKLTIFTEDIVKSLSEEDRDTLFNMIINNYATTMFSSYVKNIHNFILMGLFLYWNSIGDETHLENYFAKMLCLANDGCRKYGNSGYEIDYSKKPRYTDSVADSVKKFNASVMESTAYTKETNRNEIFSFLLGTSVYSEDVSAVANIDHIVFMYDHIEEAFSKKDADEYFNAVATKQKLIIKLMASYYINNGFNNNVEITKLDKILGDEKSSKVEKCTIGEVCQIMSFIKMFRNDNQYTADHDFDAEFEYLNQNKDLAYFLMDKTDFFGSYAESNIPEESNVNNNEDFQDIVAAYINKKIMTVSLSKAEKCQRFIKNIYDSLGIREDISDKLNDKARATVLALNLD
jgi:hypothetical protein